LELKVGWNPEAILHTMCAFANLGSGYIFVGVAENQGQPLLPPAGLPASKLDAIQKEIFEITACARHEQIQEHARVDFERDGFPNGAVLRDSGLPVGQSGKTKGGKRTMQRMP
jgi:predicted HTH transcriptional regulator